MAGADVEVQMLGPLQVRRQGQVVDLGGPKQRAVLALLVLDLGRVVATSRLVEDLWAGDPPASGTVTVQGYIAGLRRALEPGTSASNSSILATEPPGYVLRLDPDQVDRLRFERLVDAGAGALGDGDPAAALAHLDAGLALVVGEPLADLSGEVFAAPIVAQIEERRLVAIEDRLDARLALGHHRSIVGELEGLAAAHPLRERLGAQLMLALYPSDRQADALRSYAAVRRSFVEELGIEPGPVLRDLERRVLAQDPALAWSSPAPVLASRSAEAPPGNDGVLVEREAAVEVLTTAWQQVQAGRTRTVLLEGMAGHGKTSVVEAFAASVGPGVALAWGRCPDHDGAPSLWAWHQVLRTLAAGGPPPPTIDVDQTPAGLFAWYDDLAAWLQGRAGRSPCVVVLDDVHRADVPTLEALRYVVANVRASPLLLVATQRPLPPGDKVAVEDAIGALVRDRNTDQVMLDALSRPAMRRLVELSTGVPLADDELEAVAARSDGSPWIVASLARDAARTGRPPSRVPIPSDVRSLGRRALAAAGPGGSIVAGAAGVLRPEFDVREVARVADRDMEATLAAVEGLAGRLYLHRATDPRRYRWAVGILGELAVEELAAADRVALHARAAEVVGDRLDRMAATEPGRAALVEDVVEHVIQSVDAIVSDRGLRLLEAVTDADQAGDDRSRLLLERAARAVDELDPSEAQGYAGARIRVRLLDLAIRRHGLASPEARAQAALLARPGWSDPRAPRLALSRWTLFLQALLAADVDDARRYLDEIDPAASGGYPTALRRSAEGILRLHQGDIQAAVELLAGAAPETERPATENVRSGPIDAVFAVTHASLAVATAASGDADGATGPMAAALAEGSRREPWLLVLVECTAGWLAVVRDDPEVALRIGGDATRHAENLGAPDLAAWARAVEAWGDGMLDPSGAAGAAKRLRQAADDLAGGGLGLLRGMHHRWVADLLVHGGEPVAAEEEVDAARRWSAGNGLRLGTGASP